MAGDEPHLVAERGTGVALGEVEVAVLVGWALVDRSGEADGLRRAAVEANALRPASTTARSDCTMLMTVA
jgi:hypothetical protein